MELTKVKDYWSLSTIYSSGGIFSTIANTPTLSSKLEWLTTDIASVLDKLYYNRSANKILLSHIVELYDMFKTNSNTEQFNTELGTLLVNKYYNKWNVIYNTLILNDVDPLTTYKDESTETPNITKNKTSNENTASNDSKQNTYSSNREVATNMSSSSNKSQQDDYYGFNSSEKVPKNENNLNSTETITGTGKDNYTKIQDNANETTDTTRTKDFTEEQTETGSITKHSTGYRDTAPSKLISDEIKMRNLYNLFDIILNDLDDLITLLVY